MKGNERKKSVPIIRWNLIIVKDTGINVWFGVVVWKDFEITKDPFEIVLGFLEHFWDGGEFSCNFFVIIRNSNKMGNTTIQQNHFTGLKEIEEEKGRVLYRPLIEGKLEEETATSKFQFWARDRWPFSFEEEEEDTSGSKSTPNVSQTKIPQDVDSIEIQITWVYQFFFFFSFSWSLSNCKDIPEIYTGVLWRGESLGIYVT